MQWDAYSSQGWLDPYPSSDPATPAERASLLRAHEEAKADLNFQRALVEERQRESLATFAPCACGAKVSSIHADDHATLCPAALVPCPLGCGVAPMPHETLWTRHLARECPQYVIRCSSFRCSISEAPATVLDPRSAPRSSSFRERVEDGAQNATAASSSSSSSSSSSAGASVAAAASSSSSAVAASVPREVEPIAQTPSLRRAGQQKRQVSWKQFARSRDTYANGCNILRGGVSSSSVCGGSESDVAAENDAARHVHYHADRLAFESGRFFARPETQPEDAEFNRLAAVRARDSGFTPASAYLLSCPCCSQRLVVATAAYTEDLAAQEEARLKAAAASGSSDPAPAAAAESLHSSDGTPWKHTTEKLILTQQEAREHFEACEARRDTLQLASAPNRPLPPSAFDSRRACTAIFKFLPIVPDVQLAPEAASAPAAVSSSSSSTSSSSSLPSSVPFSRQLASVMLLWHAKELPPLPARSSAWTSSASAAAYTFAQDSPKAINARETIEQLFRGGASLGDVLLLHERAPKSISMHLLASSCRGEALMEAGGMFERLARAQRPLVAPLLDPVLIPDLARIVLEYF